MKVFRISQYAGEHYSYIDFETGLDIEFLDDITEGIKKSVDNLEHSMKLKNKSKELPDVLGTTPADFIINDKVKSIIENHVLEGEINFISVTIENNPFWLLNIVGLLDCFDYENSEYSTFKDGFPDEITLFQPIKENIPECSIFRIEEDTTCLFITEKLKIIFEEAGVKGVKFNDDMNLSIGI